MVVLVNGSPRKEMCTYTALKEVASALERNGIETKIIQASLEKEAIDEAVKEIEASDGIVVGSPVYYASPTGLVLSFLDAVFNRVSSSMRLKVGAAVVSCRRGGASSSRTRRRNTPPSARCSRECACRGNLSGPRGRNADHEDSGKQYGICHQVPEKGFDSSS